MLALEIYPPTSDSNGMPVLIPPLSFVIGISMFKDFWEDWSRRSADHKENSKKVQVGTCGEK